MQYMVHVDDDTQDTFDSLVDNVACIKVLNAQNKDITRDAHVEIFLSQTALLGLGTELIRLAHHFNPGKHTHLEPTSAQLQIQRMGILLTPDSANTMICCDTLKSIDEYFAQR